MKLLSDEIRLRVHQMRPSKLRTALEAFRYLVGEEEIPLAPAASVIKCCRVIPKESCTVAPWTEAGSSLAKGIAMGTGGRQCITASTHGLKCHSNPK